jgi:hypothetical protein
LTRRPGRRDRRAVAPIGGDSGPAAGGTHPSPDPRVGRSAVRPPALDSLVTVPTYRDQPATIATDPTGSGLDGQPRNVPVVGTGRWSLLLFLSSRCDGCRQFWEALGDPVGSGLTTDETVVVVTRDPGEEEVAAVRGLAMGSVPVVMSTATWSAYRVQGPPFFSLVDGGVGVGSPDVPASPLSGVEPSKADGRGPLVTTEGVAWSVQQVADDVRRARSRRSADGRV